MMFQVFFGALLGVGVVAATVALSLAAGEWLSRRYPIQNSAPTKRHPVDVFDASVSWQAKREAQRMQYRRAQV